MVSYADFGALRFLDCFPKTELYFDDSMGGTVTIIGYACVAGYAFTGFARLGNEENTGAIMLDFGHDCPETEGNALLRKVGVEFGKGSSLAAVVRVLGNPEEDKTNAENYRFCVFRSGQPRYYITCAFDPNGGLERVGVAREDLVRDGF
jgi:hypothetical protein